LVDRPRLRGTLDRAASGAFTLISAGPGSGKTVLLAAWAARARPRPWLAWLTCEPGETRVPAFWAQVLGAIHHSPAAEANPELRTLVPPRTDRDDPFVGRLVDALASLPQPLVLVVDDAQELSRGPVADRLQRLVQLAPSRLHLVLSSTRDPFVPLSRLRADGLMTEIRGSDLAFTVDEAGRLMERLGVTLQREGIETLVARTEGWAAGLRMAARYLESADDVDAAIHEFAGTDQVVADYLIEQVLVGHDDRRRFLLFTSLVERFTPELAQALTGEARIDPILGELKRDNLVSVERDGWLRYHGLVAELLRSRLRAQHRAEIPRLHAVAAAWFGERELLAEAVRHAGLARDGALLARTVKDISLVHALGDQGPEIHSVLERHTAGAALQQPGPRVTLAASRLAAKDADGALRLVSGISEGAPMGQKAQRRVEARAAAVGLAAARQLADLPVALRWSDRASAANLQGFDDDEAEWIRAMILANVGWARLWAGPVADSVDALEEAVVTSSAIDDVTTELDGRSLLAVAWGWKGRPAQAQRTAESVIRFAGQRGLSHSLELAPAYVALAWAHDQRGEPDAMAAALERSREIARGEEPSDSPLTAVQAAMTARLHRWRGEPGIGANLLSAVRRRMADPGHRLLAESIAVEEASLHAAAGRDGAAHQVLDEVEREARRTAAELVRARLAISAGRPADAVMTLRAALEEPNAFAPDVVETWVVLALTLAAGGDDVGAWESLERALFLAAEDRHLRGFLLDDGVGALVAAQLEAGTEHGELCRRLLDRIDSLLPDPSAAPPAEELSRRERVVLRYLATLMSVQEIADAMFVSTNTVKTHIKHIYRKLDVSRRRDAVESARARRLLRAVDTEHDDAVV
jgi:LuxR family maltose regulon positive regulatory protein